MYRDGRDSFGGKNEFQENRNLLSIKISIQLNWQKHLVKKDHGVWEGIENMGFLGLLLWKEDCKFQFSFKDSFKKDSESVIKESRIRCLDCYGYHYCQKKRKTSDDDECA